MLWIYHFPEQLDTSRDALKYPRLLDALFRHRGVEGSLSGWLAKVWTSIVCFWIGREKQRLCTHVYHIGISLAAGRLCHILLISHSHFSSPLLNHRLWKAAKVFAICWVACFKASQQGMYQYWSCARDCISWWFTLLYQTPLEEKMG